MTTTRDFAAANAKSLARLAMEPDTDWHAEALMYSNALGKVKDWCDMQHPKRPFYYGNEVSSIECGCAECESKRRILAIIARNLK